MNTLTATYAALDNMSHADLFRHVAADIKAKQGFSADLAERLNRLFTVKLVRLLRSPSVSDVAFEQLDNLIARIARDTYRDELDAMPARYASRWQALRDVLAANSQIDAFNGAAREAGEQPASAWEIVAEMVVAAGRDGVRWSDAKDAVITHNLGPKTKGGVSQMISSMRAHGWIDVLPSAGQRVTLVAGKNIANSCAWQRQPRIPKSGTVADAGLALHESLSNALTEIARKAVSLNQGAFLDFSHLAHERHRQLRMTLDRAPAMVEPEFQTCLKTHLDDLISFMDKRFATIATHNFNLLKQYFAGRSHVGPRMCIMGVWKRPGNPACVSPIIRDGQVHYDGAAEAADNTGFDNVLKLGTFYLNNNIVKTALSGEYHNPRFDYDAIRAFQRQPALTDHEHSPALPPGTWRSFWKGATADADARDFYRSTLIVPLTLRNENLSDEFNQSLATRFARHTGDGSAISAHTQSIVGFLCFDHPDIDYFHREHDVNTAYVFASLLSMYLLERITLTTLSATYHDASKKIVDMDEALVGKRRKKLRGVTARHVPRVPRPHLELEVIPDNRIQGLENASFSLPAACSVE